MQRTVVTFMFVQEGKVKPGDSIMPSVLQALIDGQYTEDIFDMTQEDVDIYNAITSAKEVK